MVAGPRFGDAVERIAARPGVKKVCDVGGGATPLLPLEFVKANGLEYSVLDVSSEELAKAPAGYTRVHADITSPELRLPDRYDLVFSRSVAEHVRDPEAFHRNILRHLVDEGAAVHFFPTLYALPFVINRILPEAVSDRILQFTASPSDRDLGRSKFRAYYRWCRGPTRRQVGRLEELGYRVEEYVGFFGSGGYYGKLPPLQALDRAFAGRLLRRPAPLLTTYAYVLLRRRTSVQ